MTLLFRSLFTLSVLAGSVGLASAAIERTVEKTFPVSGRGTLHVETHGGAIRVESSTRSEVTVTARQRIRASNEAEADALLKNLELTMDLTGNDVRVVSRYEQAKSGFRFSFGTPVKVDFVVRVPASFAADLRTSGGGITVGDLEGSVSARTSGGSIKVGAVGSDVDARTSGGSIRVAGTRGEANLQTSGGSIEVGELGGRANLSTSGGSIRIDSAAQAVTAHTSGGGIQANLAGPLVEDCSLSTSGGSVRVTVSKTAAFRLEASASGGGVNADGVGLDVETSSRNRLAGTVNGGGPQLKLRTSGGSVTLRAN